MFEPFDKSKHYNLLIAENKKNDKKKRVSFSLFQVDSFEEIVNLRKMRENQLNEFVASKNRTNKLRLINSKQTTKPKEISNRYNVNNNNSNINANVTANFNFNESQSKNSNYDRHYTQISKEKEQKENFVRIEYNEPQDINIKEEEQQQKKELIRLKIEEEERQRIIIEEENRKREEIEAEIKRKKEEEEEEIEKEKKRQIEEELLIKEQEEKNKKEKIILMQNKLTSFIHIISPIFNNSKSFIQFYFPQFILSLREYIDVQIDNYINYEITDSNFSNQILNMQIDFNKRIHFAKFLYNVRERLYKNQIHLNHIEKGKKYSLYRQYKQKAQIFSAIATFTLKQREWIHKTQIELSKGLLWTCIDCLKLYVNYRKIKKYLKTKKKKFIFDAFKDNVQETNELNKKSHRVNLIFLYKSFFQRVKRDRLLKKGMIVNEKISNEYKYQNQLKKVFYLLFNYYKSKKEKILKSKKRFNIKHENKDFINIKVTQKETIKYKNDTTTKHVYNKINIL